MEASASSTRLDDEDNALKSLLDSFGSAFSFEDIASAFCKAERDVKLAGELLSGMRTNSSSDAVHVYNNYVKSECSLDFSSNSEFSKSYCTNGNGDVKVLKSKRNPVSMGTVSSIIGKKYVWRAKGNITPNETKPVTVEANKFSRPMHFPEEAFSGRDADARLNKDFENFLFEMLGQGFQLERSAIREVLGHCGYDMKKSLETLLDLTAVTLDQRNNFHEGSNLNSYSETLSFQNQEQKQKIAESGSRMMRTNGLLSRQPNERYEQQKEVLTALFHVPERRDLTVRTPVLKSVRRSGLFGKVVAGPLEDIDEDPEAKATSHHLISMKDETQEDDYQILRKAVREHRDTMKEYYKAAADAFASGDRARAGILLEKGQFFLQQST